MLSSNDRNLSSNDRKQVILNHAKFEAKLQRIIEFKRQVPTAFTLPTPILTVAQKAHPLQGIALHHSYVCI